MVVLLFGNNIDVVTTQNLRDVNLEFPSFAPRHNSSKLGFVLGLTLVFFLLARLSMQASSALASFSLSLEVA